VSFIHGSAECCGIFVKMHLSRGFDVELQLMVVVREIEECCTGVEQNPKRGQDNFS
jgi:hypothetical protein